MVDGMDAVGSIDELLEKLTSGPEGEVSVPKPEDKRTKNKQKKQKERQQPAAASDEADRPSEIPADVSPEEFGIQSRPTIYVIPWQIKLGKTLRSITDRLIETGACFNRCNRLMNISSDTIKTILAAPEFKGMLSQYVEFNFEDKDGNTEFKPLKTDYCDTWLNNAIELAQLKEIKLFTKNPVFTQDWRLVAPGFDAESGIYYIGNAIDARSDTPRLNALLKGFCFKTVADRTNYLGMLLTAILMPHFIGSKPGVLFNGNQPLLGKSILAQIIAIVRDGHEVETASYNPNDEEFEKRLGSIVRSNVTTVIVDNAKGKGRKARIESACLERSITDSILSFRLLGKSQDIRAENSHIFCITANAPDVSADLISRCVIVNLFHLGDPKRRKHEIQDPEEYAKQYRVEILGELIGMVERWKAAGTPLADVETRFNKRGWGHIVGGILQACGEPDFMANAEEAAEELDDTRREFVELIALMVNREALTSTEMANLCSHRNLLTADFSECVTPKSRQTKMGMIAGRFVDEMFRLPDGREVVFRKQDGRNSSIYRVGILESTAEVKDERGTCGTLRDLPF